MIRLPLSLPNRTKRLDIEPYILGKSDSLYILNKPWGWPTSGATLDDDDCVQYHLMQYHQSMVWTVHQLDADTTGVCLFATHKRKVKVYHRKLTAPHTAKQYLAVVRGEPNWKQIEVTKPIGLSLIHI